MLRKVFTQFYIFDIFGTLRLRTRNFRSSRCGAEFEQTGNTDELKSLRKSSEDKSTGDNPSFATYHAYKLRL